MAKPKYIRELEEKVQKLTEAHNEIKQNQDNMLVAQGNLAGMQTEMSKSIESIRDCLLGDEFSSPCNGGMIHQFNETRKQVHQLLRWKDKATVTASILYSITTGTLAFFSAVIIRNWDKLFGSGG